MATQAQRRPSTDPTPPKPFPRARVTSNTPSPSRTPRPSLTPVGSSPRLPLSSPGNGASPRPRRHEAAPRSSLSPLKTETRVRRSSQLHGAVSPVDEASEGREAVQDVFEDQRDETERRWVEEPEAMEWELRTETANHVDEDGTPVAQLRIEHAKEIAHYRKLLVRAQSASSSSLHELHSKLHDVESRYALLDSEHATCRERLAVSDRVGQDEGGLVAMLSAKNSAGLSRAIRRLEKDDRRRVLETVIQACHPSDIAAQIAVLEKYKQSSYDVLGRLPDDLAVRVIYQLDLEEILRLRLVSRHYDYLASLPVLWEKLCRDLEWRDWDRGAIEEPHIGWKSLYRGLRRRERNWSTGAAQTVRLLRGHSNYVTSLKLRGNVLISGSYDETIRIWDMPALSALSPVATLPHPPLVVAAKAVSCLDYLPSENIFVVGAHDVGRVQVWHQKSSGGWEVEQTLAGHLHGIRAVAIDERWLVSAGADKAIVVWDWRTGQKVMKFGQQTNICVGIQLIDNTVVAVTVDAVIRVFSISSRDMVAQYRTAELGRSSGAAGTGAPGRLKDVGVGVGGMVTWMEGQEGWLTCATKDTIIRLEWEHGNARKNTSDPLLHPARTPRKSLPLGSSPARTSNSTPLRTPDSTARGTPGSAAVRQRTVSGVTPSGSRGRLTGDRKSLTPLPVPSPTPARAGGLPRPTALLATGEVDNQLSISSDRRSGSRSGSGSQSGASSRPRTNGNGTKGNGTNDTDEGGEKQTRSPKDQQLAPLQRGYDFTRAPRVIEVVEVSDIERGTIDARRSRMVLSTRFAARTGAERRLFVGAPGSGSGGSTTSTAVMPIGGAWEDLADKLDLQSPGKNPMSIVLDQEKLVYGCSDGTIVVVGFVGDEYPQHSQED